MQRLKDYSNFMAWFAGLGYGLLWLFARGDALPLALHTIGLLALTFVMTRLVLHFLQRAAGKALPGADLPKALSHGRSSRPLPSVKPRTQFGLRDTPR